MDYNFSFWLDAFTKYLNGQSDTPPVPPPQKLQQQNRKAEQPANIPKPAIAPDNDTLRPEDIYMIPSQPEGGWQEPEPVGRIILTKEEALAQGWRFCLKRAKITHYRGTEKDIIVPAQIGKRTIREIGVAAFENTNIDSVKIPETVRKLGARCFAGSTVKKLVIAGAAEDIPAEFAAGCAQLSEVQHRCGNGMIRRCAFEHCVSLKQFSIHPKYITTVEEGAFRGSGLQAFSCHRLSDLCGSAFVDTPLWRRCKLLMLLTFGNDYYKVVLVGRDARSLILPAGHIKFVKHSIPDLKDSISMLDCSHCRSVEFDNYAIVHHPVVCCGWNYGAQYGMRSREPLCITVPQKTQRFFYTDQTEVQYADGKPFPPFLTRISEDDSEAVYEVFGEDLPACTLPPENKSIRLKGTTNSHYSWRDYRICYEKEAVQSRKLERITFEMPLSGEAPLFGEECRSLHFVSWLQARKQVQVYLPSADLIGEWVHWYLLKAFHAHYVLLKQDSVRWEERLFRSEIFDRMFRQQDNTGPRQGRRTENMWYPTMLGIFSRSGVPVLKQRQKIMLAADVMRSTPELFPKREMYRKYLLTHRRYALKLCETLPQEYADFLREFYEVKS